MNKNIFLCEGGCNGQKPTELSLRDIDRVVSEMSFNSDRVCHPNRSECFVKIVIPLNKMFTINSLNHFVYSKDYPIDRQIHGELGIFQHKFYFVFLDEKRNDNVMEFSKICDGEEIGEKYYLEFTGDY